MRHGARSAPLSGPERKRQIGMQLNFRGLTEDDAGGAWRKRVRPWLARLAGVVPGPGRRSGAAAWRCPQGAAARTCPKWSRCGSAWSRRVDGDDTVARFLSFWSPPRYLVQLQPGRHHRRRRAAADPQLRPRPGTDTKRPCCTAPGAADGVMGMVEGLAGLADGMQRRRPRRVADLRRPDRRRTGLRHPADHALPARGLSTTSATPSSCCAVTVAHRSTARRPTARDLVDAYHRSPRARCGQRSRIRSDSMRTHGRGPMQVRSASGRSQGDRQVAAPSRPIERERHLDALLVAGRPPPTPWRNSGVARCFRPRLRPGLRHRLCRRLSPPRLARRHCPGTTAGRNPGGIDGFEPAERRRVRTLPRAPSARSAGSPIGARRRTGCPNSWAKSRSAHSAGDAASNGRYSPSASMFLWNQA